MNDPVRGKRRRVRTGWWSAAVFFGVIASCRGGAAQTAASVVGAPNAPLQAMREIDDPQTGARWLLVRNPSYPGGPGRLVMAAGVREDVRTSGKGKDAAAHAVIIAALPRPVIRGGDRLIVEEDTAVVSARLEAVALGPAPVGGRLRARLEIGGRVVRVVALAPGRARLTPPAWGRP